MLMHWECDRSYAFLVPIAYLARQKKTKIKIQQWHTIPNERCGMGNWRFSWIPIRVKGNIQLPAHTYVHFLGANSLNDTISFPSISFPHLRELKLAGVQISIIWIVYIHCLFFIKYCREIKLNECRWRNTCSLFLCISIFDKMFCAKKSDQDCMNRWLITWSTNLHLNDKRKCVRIDPISEVWNANPKTEKKFKINMKKRKARTKTKKTTNGE